MRPYQQLQFKCLLPIKQKVGPHCLLLLSVPLNHKAVPNALCCTNCAVSKACCPTIKRLCPLHAAQGHIHCMLLRAVSNACYPTTAYDCQQHAQYLLPTISLYPMPAAPQSKSCQCIPLPTARLLAFIAYHSTTTTFTCLHSAPQPQCGTPLQCHLISTSSHSMHTLNTYCPLTTVCMVTNACWHSVLTIVCPWEALNDLHDKSPQLVAKERHAMGTV